VIYLRHQVSLRAGETVRVKQAFKQFAKQNGVKIKSYRADNLPFNSKEFRDDLALHDQTIDFSGVGAHHQARPSAVTKEIPIQSQTITKKVFLIPKVKIGSSWIR
jgi:hypothetical protein